MPAAAKLIQISPMGNVGNRMIQYMAALALADRVPGATIARVHLPEWGIHVAPDDRPFPRQKIVENPRVDLAGLASALNDGTLDMVDIRTYGQRMENFLQPVAYRSVFAQPDRPVSGPDELLCNIRQGELLSAPHPDYVLIPIDFYAELVERTGLSPVFHGQIEDSAYMIALRARFPAARYVPSAGTLADFAAIRGARYVVPSVSTFSWLAAWLSHAERIFLPVLGLLNTHQARSVDLLPLDDPRYEFHLFPHHYAVQQNQLAASHAAIRGMWRMMPPTALRGISARSLPPLPLEDYHAAFDEDFYRRTYPDIAAVVRDRHMPSGRHHFIHHGIKEGREPFDIDRAWYCQTYPIAAVELSQGDAKDVWDHWLRLGRARGYRRNKKNVLF